MFQKSFISLIAILLIISPSLFSKDSKQNKSKTASPTFYAQKTSPNIIKIYTQM